MDGIAAEAAPDPDPDPDPAPAPAPELVPLTALQSPVGGTRVPFPFFCTTAPGSGKAKSELFTV